MQNRKFIKNGESYREESNAFCMSNDFGVMVKNVHSTFLPVMTLT